jgi:hypothetical protein
MATPVLRPLALGELLDVSFALYRMLFAPLFLVALVAHGLPSLLEIYIGASGGFAANLLFGVGNLVLSVILGAVGVAATTFIVSDHYLGGSTTALGAFARSWEYLGRLVVMSILASFLIGVGVLLLIVPGIIVAAGLAVAPPAVVLERIGSATEGLRRSWDLTRGYKGKVAGTLFVALLLVMLPSIALGGLVAAGTLLAPGGLETLLQAAVILLSVLIYPFLNVAITVLYYDLRVRKEGFDLEVLATSLQG